MVSALRMFGVQGGFRVKGLGELKSAGTIPEDSAKLVDTLLSYSKDHAGRIPVAMFGKGRGCAYQ